MTCWAAFAVISNGRPSFSTSNSNSLVRRYTPPPLTTPPSPRALPPRPSWASPVLHSQGQVCRLTKQTVLPSRMQIGALLGQEAPGNLGRNPLEGLPSRFQPSASRASPDPLVDLTDSPLAPRPDPATVRQASDRPSSSSKLDFLSPSSSHERHSPGRTSRGASHGPITPAARYVPNNVSLGPDIYRSTSIVPLHKT